MEKIKKTLRDNAAMRWLVLILVSSLLFSTYWFQDFYSGLKALVETDLGFTSEQFGRMIGLTTIANMMGMIIVGGIILDKWGIRIAGLVFGGLATLGGLISALGASGVFGTDTSTMLTTLIIGRILFGTGLEVVCVVATRTIVKWFKGYELALAMAINMGFGRLGSALSIALSLDIAGSSVSPAVTFAATLIGLSLIMFVIYLFFDIKLDKQQKAIKAADVNQEKSADEDFKFSDLVKLATNKSFIYIALLCVAFYSAVFPFIIYAPDLLVNKFNFSYNLPVDNWKTKTSRITYNEEKVFVAEGEKALRITLQTESKHVINSEDFDVNPGEPYTISFDVQDEQEFAKARLGIGWNENEVDWESQHVSEFSSKKDGFQTIQISDTIPDGVNSAHLEVQFDNTIESNTLEGAEANAGTQLTFYLDNFNGISNGKPIEIKNASFESWPGNIIILNSSILGTLSVYLVFFIFGLSVSMVPLRVKSPTNKVMAVVSIVVLFLGYIYANKDVLGLWLQNGPKTASLIPLGTIIFTPIFGSYVDRKGKAASLMILGSLLLIFAHLSLSIFQSPILAYMGLLSLGIAFSLVPAAMWPSVAKIVAENRLGTAYASMFTVQNWGLGIFFWGIGALLDFVNKSRLDQIRAGELNYDYTVPILVLVACGAISIFLAFKLKQADLRQGYGLEEPS